MNVSEALNIARNTREKLLSDSIQVASALRACWTVCTLLKRERDYDWIDSELNGYLHKYESEGEMEKALPHYRKSRCMYLDVFNRPLSVPTNIDFIQDYPLGEPIAELEDEKTLKNGLTLFGPRINMLREKLNVPVASAHISSVNVLRVVNAVKNRTLDFLNATIMKMEYATMNVDIFDEARERVDKALMHISPKTLEKLVQTYRKLSAMSTPLEHSQVAFACREIVQDFTDAIHRPEYLREEEQPKHEQTKNKMKYALRAKLEGKKDRESELLLAHIDYMTSYFDKLTAYIQKQIHAKDFEPTHEDANRCVIYTYLIM